MLDVDELLDGEARLLRAGLSACASRAGEDKQPAKECVNRWSAHFFPRNEENFRLDIRRTTGGPHRNVRPAEEQSDSSRGGPAGLESKAQTETRHERVDSAIGIKIAAAVGGWTSR